MSHKHAGLTYCVPIVYHEEDVDQGGFDMLLDVPNDIARLFVLRQIATKMLLEEPFRIDDEVRFSEELMLDVEIEDGLAQVALYDTELRSTIPVKSDKHPDGWPLTSEGLSPSDLDEIDSFAYIFLLSHYPGPGRTFLVHTWENAFHRFIVS